MKLCFAIFVIKYNRAIGDSYNRKRLALFFSIYIS